jgi:hypothetical protein
VGAGYVELPDALARSIPMPHERSAGNGSFRRLGSIETA